MGRGILIALLALGTVLGFGMGFAHHRYHHWGHATAATVTALTRSKTVLQKLAFAPRNAWEGSAAAATPHDPPHRRLQRRPPRPHRDGERRADYSFFGSAGSISPPWAGSGCPS